MNTDEKGMQLNNTPFEDIIFTDLGFTVDAILLHGENAGDSTILIQRSKVAEMFDIAPRTIQQTIQYGIERGVISKDNVYYRDVVTSGGKQSIAFLDLQAMNYVGVQARATSERVILFQRWAINSLAKLQLEMIRELQAENARLALDLHHATVDLNDKLVSEFERLYPDEMENEDNG